MQQFLDNLYLRLETIVTGMLTEWPCKLAMYVDLAEIFAVAGYTPAVQLSPMLQKAGM
jgi:hypothetical protein